MRKGRRSLMRMPPYLHALGTKDWPWSKFSLWLNWYAVRSRPSRGAGTARACSAPRAASAAARAARLRDLSLPPREGLSLYQDGSEFLAHRARAERTADAGGDPRKTAQLAHDAIAQGERFAAPAQRPGDVEQRQLRHAEFTLVGIIAGAEIETADAVGMQRLHGALDHQ